MTTLPAGNRTCVLSAARPPILELARMPKHQQPCAEQPREFSLDLLVPDPATLQLSEALTSPSRSKDQVEQMAFSTRRRRPLVALPVHPEDQMRRRAELPGYVSVRDLLLRTGKLRNRCAPA